MESIMTRKGQVTIPKEIRDRLGVKEGEKVLFVLRGDEIILKVVKGTILDLRGSVRLLPRSLWTLEIVLYKLEKQAIAAKVEKILNTPNLECPQAPLLFTALDLYVHENIDFIDADNAFYMREFGFTQIVTYDRKHFARVPWVSIQICRRPVDKSSHI